MATKLSIKTYPQGHGPDDFQCFGPPASKDDQFENTMIVDLGCFAQEDVDSNKYYHGAVVQSKKDKSWHAYFEYGRVGARNPAFQFVSCGSKEEAEREYIKQIKKKNVKRGTWEDHKILGHRLIPKIDRHGKSKDLYIVRPQATRSTGLTDARTITSNEGAKKAIPKRTKSAKPSADHETLSLMRDLNVGAIQYTRSAMADAAIPTQNALDQSKDILQVALGRVKTVGGDTDDQTHDKELKQLTRDIYSLIPKKKNRGADPLTWILSQDNINVWMQDIDAFESALYATDLGDAAAEDPFGGMNIKMEHLPKASELGGFIHQWMPRATRNKHSYLGSMKVRNVWSVERAGDVAKISGAQKKIAGRWQTDEKPFNQPRRRPDLNRDEAKAFVRSGTYMFFHGTRTVNVTGILRESLRLPKKLVGVKITGAMFGPGIYWADDWKKSAGYTSLSQGYYTHGAGSVQQRKAFMFVADVAIGKPFVAPSSKGFTKAPEGHHSVFGKTGHTKSWNNNTLMNNEFITYDGNSNRLRYLIEFDV